MTVPRLNPAGRFDPVRLFRPKSIAVMGAESETGAQVSANLVLAGFQGAVSTQPAQGTCLAVLALPPGGIGAAMEALAAANCFAAIVPGACDDLAAHSARTGVRALGPHAFGLAVPSIGLNATTAHIPPPKGRLALVTQSAGLARSVIDWAEPNGVGFSHVVGLGANAGIGFSLTLDWLSRDAGTGAILLDIGRIKDRRQFLSAARAAARLRPVVAIRAGLDGNDQAFEAALRRAGVLYVKGLEDLLAAAETLSRAKPLRRDTLSIVANAPGPAQLAADAAGREGTCLAPGSPVIAATPELAATAFALADRPETGGVLVVHAPDGNRAAIDAMCRPPAGLRAPVLVCAMGETTGSAHRAALAKAGLPAFATPGQAVQGFGHLVRDRRNREAARELPPGTVLALAPDKDRVRRLLAAAPLAQDQALEVLAAYGIPTIPTRFAARPGNAAEAAALLGFPVVAKLRSVRPPGDRPAGSLAFDLQDTASAAAAARLLSARAARRGEPAEVLVQRQAGRGRELAIRVADDPTFGPAICFGPGGTQPDPGGDATDLPPLNLALARALVRRARAGALLGRPLRDRPPADPDAVADVLVRVSQLIVDFPEIAALEIPSLFADQQGVTAVDAWIRLRGDGEPLGRLAIAPYPQDLSEQRDIAGQLYAIRPIRPEDAAAHAAFFARLSPEDIRYRFFSAMRELSAEQTARMTQVDYDREMAFVAVREATAETVGVARLVCEQGNESGEFAVVVQADMKGKGLASHLMRRLIAWARVQGLRRIVGQVLADNAPMLAFVRRLGFAVSRMRDEPEVMEAVLELPATAP